MMNPKWKRVINVSKIRIELLKMKLQMEFDNGKIHSPQGRQSSQTGDPMGNQPTEVVTEQRNPVPNSGTDNQDS